MFREMRRKNQQLSQQESLAVLQRGSSGVLALSGDEGYPYAVALNFVYHDGSIYFHCAKSGYKLDAILRDDRGCFCVVDRDEIVQEKYTSYFRSAVAFGRAHILEDEEKKREALKRLAEKYSPDYTDGIDAEIDRLWKNVCVIEFRIEQLTGKQARELCAQHAKDAQ